MSKPRPAQIPLAAMSAGAAPVASMAASQNLRTSNGLKEFLWLLSDVRHGRLLDLGPVWQSTVGFFTDRGFRVTTEDLLRSWKEFLDAEEQRLRRAPVGGNAEVMSPAALAERFVETSLQYPAETFHGVLAWDLPDYLDHELLARVMARLHRIVRPAGAVLALFHSRSAERFHRYRIRENQTVELLAAPPLVPHARVFQNREILDLFGQFRSSKTFVGRDQIREGLFVK